MIYAKMTYERRGNEMSIFPTSMSEPSILIIRHQPANRAPSPSFTPHIFHTKISVSVTNEKCNRCNKMFAHRIILFMLILSDIFQVIFDKYLEENVSFLPVLWLLFLWLFHFPDCLLRHYHSCQSIGFSILHKQPLFSIFQ